MSFIINPFVYPSIDPDCAAFLTATGITNPTISGAVCTLVTSLKSANLWNKFNAIYPFVGGTAITHKFNLKNPADTNVAFRLVFTGGWTHNSNGITGNGVNVAANTFVNNLMLNKNSCHISTYSRTNVEQQSIDIGSGGFTDGLHHALRWPGLGAFFRTFLSGTPSVANLNSQGLYVSTRTASNLSKMYKNGSAIITSSIAVAGQDPLNIYIGAYQGTGFFTTRNISFSTIGSGLTDSDASSMYTIVQTFQTTLGRQV
jgi:hypothetical protein